MSTDEQTARTERFVEEVGVFFERLGTTRMAGRVFGRLLISAPPHQAMDELAEALHASKGSISTSTRYLIQLGMIERIGMPGERRDYFRMKPNIWANMLRQRVEILTHFEDLARRGLELIKGESYETRERLLGFLDYCEFIEEEFPDLFQRWEEWRKAREESARSTGGTGTREGDTQS